MSDSSVALSIIIPVYNAELYLEMAVQSVLNQDLSALEGALEIILVNDGSTDNSAEIARALARQHAEIQVVEKPNGGLASARNAGIKRARGQALCFLDADDEYAEGALDFLMRELRALRQTSGDLVMVRGLLQNLAPDETGAHWRTVGEPYAVAVVHTNAQTRQTVEAIGDFDEDLRACEDTDWMMRAQEIGIVMPYYQRLIVLYRRHASNMTNDANYMRAAKKKALRKMLLRVRARRR